MTKKTFSKPSPGEVSYPHLHFLLCDAVFCKWIAFADYIVHVFHRVLERESCVASLEHLRWIGLNGKLFTDVHM